MGAVTRVFVTGGSGFIGRAVVTAAKQAGLEVIAPSRSDVDLSGEHAAVTLAEAMQGCQVVVHLAAAMGGDADAHERVTVGGTRAVLQGMRAAGIGDLVLVSSLAVYDLQALSGGQPVTSETPRLSSTNTRDAYSAAKLQQELLAEAAGLDNLTILRPGIVFDAKHQWNAHLGVGLGPALLRFPARTVLPMCHVDVLAARIVEAASARSTTTELLVDDNLPTRGEVIADLRATGWSKLVLPFPWGVLRLAALGVSPLEQHLPGLLRRDVLEQRMYPMGRVT